jgi:hypothetical protein
MLPQALVPDHDPGKTRVFLKSTVYFIEKDAGFPGQARDRLARHDCENSFILFVILRDSFFISIVSSEKLW